MLEASLENTRLISNMLYVILSYIQSGQFVNFNNTLDTKDSSAVYMIIGLRDNLYGTCGIIGFSNDEILNWYICPLVLYIMWYNYVLL